MLCQLGLQAWRHHELLLLARFGWNLKEVLLRQLSHRIQISQIEANSCSGFGTLNFTVRGQVRIVDCSHCGDQVFEHDLSHILSPLEQTLQLVDKQVSIDC